MTAMGALNLKVDVKTRDRFRQLHGEANNPDSHRRRTISLALDGDQQENVLQGLLNARSARGRGRRGVRLEELVRMSSQTVASYVVHATKTMPARARTEGEGKTCSFLKTLPPPLFFCQ